MLDRLNDDVLVLICAAAAAQDTPLIALSETCRRLRIFCLPHIFRSISLRCADSETWDNARQKLLTWDPASSTYVRELSVLLPIEKRYGISDTIPQDLPDKLLDMLETLSVASKKHLEKLTIVIDEGQAPVFEAAFAARSPVFTHIRRLVVSPYNDYVAKYCPNVQVFSATEIWYSRHDDYWNECDHSLRMIKQAAGLSDLKCFILGGQWNLHLMTALQESIPLINTLVISTTLLGADFTFHDFVDHLSTLGVEVLSVPEVADLNLGFSPAWHGAEYTGPNAMDFAMQVLNEQRDVEKYAASVIFQRCESVQDLWFGIYAKATRRKPKGEVLEVVWSHGEATGCPPWLTSDEWLRPAT
ncbi:hypothetical protein BDW22DRAFT_1356606 [Trametopsis cervina]|nr:hypothetical protein BDW22DRAFT_1356606 [Trametopsis cervina]